MNFINKYIDNIELKKIEEDNKKRHRPKEIEEEISLQKKREFKWKAYKIFIGIIVLVVLPTSMAIFSSVVEYGVIQPLFSSKKQILYKIIACLQLVVLLCLVLLTMQLVRTWNNRKNKFRESFVSLSSLSIISIVILNFTYLFTSVPPWRIIDLINFILSDNASSLSPNSYSSLEITLSVIISIFYTYVVNQYYIKWNGKISTIQFEREEFSGPNNLALEAIVEYNRRINHPELLREYNSPQHSLQQILPEQDIISNSWEDQSRELVMLYSVSYSFDYDQDWHDLHKCWIGFNNRSNNVVLLLPRHDIINDDEIENIITYGMSVAAQKNHIVEVVIIAVKTYDVDKSYDINGIKVQLRSENSLLDGLINLTDYKNEIRKKVTSSVIAESQLPLEKVYVKPVIQVYEGNNNLELESYLNDWIQESSRRHLALLGDYGQGKSTAALMLTYNLLFTDALITNRIPILIQLHGRNLRDQDPVEILGNWSSKYKMNGQALLRLHEAGRLLLIFEGFDEISQLADYEVRRRHFKSIWAFSAYKDSKILITGRPNLFESSKEMESALGLVDPFPGDAYCEPLKLASFNLNQIELALRNHPTEVKNKICSLAADNERFKEIVSRPSLLQIVATLWEKEKLSNIVIGLTPASIIGLFIRYSYTRQIQKEKVSLQFSSLNSSERSYFMSGIATYMASRRLSTITNFQLNNLIDKLLLYIPTEVSSQGNLISGETITPLKKRLEKSNNGYDPFKVDLLKTDIRSSGLLVVDHTSEESFKFGHKSFSEYLFAEVINERITNSYSKKERAIVQATETSIFSIMNQQVSMVFLSELLSNPKLQQKSSGKDQLYNKANSLLSTILDANSLSIFIYKARILLKIIFNSLDFYKIYSGSVITYKSVVNFLILTIAYLGYMSLIQKTAFTNNYLFTTILPLTTIVLFFILNSKIQKNQFTEKLRIWLIICRYLNISDAVIHQVIGSDKLSWVLKHQFTHFFNKDEKKIIKLLERTGEYNGFNIFLVKDFFSKKTKNYINSFVVLNHIKHYHYDTKDNKDSKDKYTFQEILRIFYSIND